VRHRERRRPKGAKNTPALVDVISQTGPEADLDCEFPRLGGGTGLRVPDFREDAVPRKAEKALAKVGSREFNQDVGAAKRAAEKAPVVITDRGRPAFVLMAYDQYRRLVGPRRSILDMLNHEESKDIEFEPERMGDWSRQFDFD
jgi:prevent-host-death family protein